MRVLMTMIPLISGCLVNQELYEQRRAALTDADGDGVSAADDCDDTDPGRFPGADEVCDDVDQDCDGVADEGAIDQTVWFEDRDGDGYGNEAVSEVACDRPAGFVAQGGDCDDGEPAAWLGAEEVAYDGVDQDCDGADLTDVDGDGVDAVVVGGTDCDDGDPSVHPGADETWFDHGVDNDCDGESREQVTLSSGDLDGRLDGPLAGGQYGRRLQTHQATGCLVATASFDDDYVGRITMDQLSLGTVRTAGAGGTVVGPEPGAFFGGDLSVSASGVVATSSVTMDAGTGAVWLLPSDWLCLGGERSASDPEVVVVWGAEESSYFGGELRWLDDIDGDGLEELAMVATHEAGEAGAAYLWLSPAMTLSIGSAEDADVRVQGDPGRHLRYVRVATGAASSGVPDVLFSQDAVGDGSAAVFRVDAPNLDDGRVAELALGSVGSWESGQTRLEISEGWAIPGGRVLTGVNETLIFQVDQVVGTQDPGSADVQVSTSDGFPVSQVWSIGDKDGDGGDDLAVVSLGWSGGTDAGAVAIVQSRDIPDIGIVDPTVSPLQLRGADGGDRFGYAIAPVGAALEADGAMLMIAAPGQNDGGTEAGAVHVVPSPF